MQLAEEWQDRLSTREIAAGLQALGYKTSKSAVSRWLQKSHVVVPEGVTIEVELESPQIGESPKQDKTDVVRVNRAGQSVDEEGRILNLDGEVATVAPMLTLEQRETQSAKTKRMKGLMVDAAIKFGESSTPFYHEWLSEREVTSDECIELSILIAKAIEDYVEQWYLDGD